jgi:Ni,Fe-hydrogenase III small subunit/Fe-S-cluster-containing hydrogenase component 2
MYNMIKKIVQYPRITTKYPKEVLDAGQVIGKPEIELSKCTFCGMCVSSCPSSAIVMDVAKKDIGINLDQCIYCTECTEVCPTGAAYMTNQVEIAAKNRNDLRHTPIVIETRDLPHESYEIIGEKIQQKAQQLFGRSLHIREVDAGSCNGCDYEINALNNSINDLERLGMHFVASPRHADLLLVTGTATRNMELALIKTYNATPDPKLVVAVGACACSGGIFRDNYATRNGIDCILPVDVYIPGCPPRPQAIMYGILKAIDRVS